MFKLKFSRHVFFGSFQGRFSRKNLKNRYNTTTRFIQHKPFISFFAVLFLLLFLIILGSIFSPKQIEAPKSQASKRVAVYNIGKAPRLTINAKINKSGVIKVMAQTSGVVQSINVNEGDAVDAGTQIVLLSTNYQGGNAPALQTQLASDQLKNINDTFQTQKDIIGKQRDLANQQSTQTSDLRNIQNQSIGETQSVLDLNNQILSSIGSNLSTLQQNNQNGQNSQQILQTQQLQVQYQNAVNGLSESLRTIRYQSSDSNAPANIASIQKDIALKQLDVQEKSLNLNKEISQVQVNIAAVNEAMMYPSTPVAGTVQKIYVRVGQTVAPGTPIAEIAGSSETVTAIASVPQEVATRITNIESSTLMINKNTYDEMPIFVSNEATDNQLFTITYAIPDKFVKLVSDGQYIQISIPVGTANTSASDPFVPIDTIFQTQTESFLYIINHGIAKVQKVELGQVFGRFTEVNSGLKNGDQVILDRTVIAGDRVAPQ